MAKLTPKFDSHHQYIWKCDCWDWHYIEVDWDDEDETWRYLSIADTYWPHRIRDRIRAAITVLRGEPHHHTGIILSDKDVADLIAVLSKHGGYDVPNR